MLYYNTEILKTSLVKMAHHIGHFKASFKANYIDFFYLVDEF
jgi:hypothetical protein